MSLRLIGLSLCSESENKCRTAYNYYRTRDISSLNLLTKRISLGEQNESIESDL